MVPLGTISRRWSDTVTIDSEEDGCMTNFKVQMLILNIFCDTWTVASM